MTISRKRLKEIEAIRDEDIDYSDIPETDAAFWADAEFHMPPAKDQRGRVLENGGANKHISDRKRLNDGTKQRQQHVTNISLLDSLNSISTLDDRSAALVAFSHLESALQRAVVNELPRCDDKNVYNKLFNNSGPLSSFYNQMWFGRALGMFGPKTCNDLNVLRKIRNGFAHEWEFDTFEVDPIRDICKNITLPEWAPKVKRKWGLEAKDHEPPKTPKDLYIWSCLRYWNAFANVLLGEEPFPLE